MVLLMFVAPLVYQPFISIYCKFMVNLRMVYIYNYGKFGDGLYTMALLTWDTMMNSPTLGISWSRQLPSLAIPSKKSQKSSGHLSRSLAFVHKLIVLGEHALPGHFFGDISGAVPLGLGAGVNLQKKMAEPPWFKQKSSELWISTSSENFRKPQKTSENFRKNQKTSENLSWNWVWWSARVSCLRLLMI